MGHKALSKETTPEFNTIKIERKRSPLKLKENRNGRFVRLTESGECEGSIVIIPRNREEFSFRVIYNWRTQPNRHPVQVKAGVAEGR